MSKNTLNARITADARPFVLATKQAQTATHTLSASIKQSSAAMAGFTTSGRAAGVSMGKLSGKFTQTKKSADKLRKSASKAAKSADKLSKSASKAAKSTSKLGKGARHAGAALTAMAARTSVAGGALASLRAGFSGAGAAAVGFGVATTAGAIAIARAGDQMKLTRARLEALTGSAAAATVGLQGTYDIAIQNGVAIRTLQPMITRLTLAMNDLGYTQPRVLELAEAISKLGIMGGSLPQEFNAAAIQLTQGLASDVLRGDEFRAVSEQLPLVAKKIAHSLDVSIGELREMAHDGLLTADVVAGAILGDIEQIRQDFEILPLTMGRSWNKVIASADLFGASLDNSLKLSHKIATAFEGIAETLTNLAGGVPDPVAYASEFVSGVENGVPTLITRRGRRVYASAATQAGAKAATDLNEYQLELSELQANLKSGNLNNQQQRNTRARIKLLEQKIANLENLIQQQTNLLEETAFSKPVVDKFINPNAPLAGDDLKELIKLNQEIINFGAALDDRFDREKEAVQKNRLLLI